MKRKKNRAEPSGAKPVLSDRERLRTFLGFAPDVQKAYLRAMQSINPEALRYLHDDPEASAVLRQLELEEVLNQNFTALKK